MRTLRTALLALVLAATAAACLPSGSIWEDEFRNEATLWFYEDLAADEELAAQWREVCLLWNTGDSEFLAGMRSVARTIVVEDEDGILRPIFNKYGVEMTAEVIDAAAQILMEIMENDCTG